MRSKFKWIYTLLVVFTMQFSFAQEKTVSGIVSDATGPIPGANVIVKGTNRGTQTDVDGKYSIKASQGETLVFSFVGQADQSKQIGAANSYNVTLKPDTKLLDEVLITGAMGIKRTKDATTTLNQVVKAKELTQASNPNAIQSLSGKVSGLQINTSSNGVNSSTRIVLRGNRSITGNNEALIVIDNSISSAAVLAQLPPEIIESINTIKGAQGAALYGEQGSNGVLIVTTKRGNGDGGGKMTVDLNSSIDFENISFLPERQTSYGQGWIDDGGFSFGAGDPKDGQGFVPWENGAWGPAFNNPDFAGQTLPVGLPQSDGTFLTQKWVSQGSDNIKKFFQTGTILQTGVTINVGDDDSYALLNVKRESRDFVVNGDELKRTSLLFKAGKRYNKFSIDGNVNYSNQSTTETSGELFDDLLQAGTNIQVERFANSAHQNNWTVYAFNPYRLSEGVRFNSKVNNFNGVLNLGYTFNKNISMSYTANALIRAIDQDRHNDGVNVGATPYDLGIYTYSGLQFETYADLGGADESSSFYVTQSIRRNFYSDLLLNLNYDLTKDIGFKLTLGNNLQDFYLRSNRKGGQSLDVPGFYNITNVLNPDQEGTAFMRNGNFIDQIRRFAIFSNLDLDFKKYLFLNATGRYEEVSNVKKSFFYPSVGVAFVPTKAFNLTNKKILSYAKISANYTVNGNSTGVGAYENNDVSQIAAGFPFGTLSGFQINRTPTTPEIKPEFVTTKELNLSLAFLNDRVTFDGSIYVADTNDLISNFSTSTASGLQTVRGNVGDLQNKGFEIDLGIVPFKSDNFTWSMKGSYSTFKTIVKSLAEGNDLLNLQANTFIGVFAEVGEEFPLIKGTAYQRDPNGNIIVDANGFPLTTTGFQKLGKATPDYIVNFSNTFNYKGLSLTAVMDYRTGHSIYSEQYPRLATFGYVEESADFDRTVGYVVPNSVQQTTPGVYTANTTAVGNGGYSAVLNYFSNRYSRIGEALLLDATAFKVRELALSYSLSKKMLGNSGIQACKFGINARNPFVKLASNNRGYTDPEATNVGPNRTGVTGNALGISELGQYPTTKTYGFTLNLTF